MKLGQYKTHPQRYGLNCGKNAAAPQKQFQEPLNKFALRDPLKLLQKAHRFLRTSIRLNEEWKAQKGVEKPQQREHSLVAVDPSAKSLQLFVVHCLDWKFAFGFKLLVSRRANRKPPIRTPPNQANQVIIKTWSTQSHVQN